LAVPPPPQVCGAGQLPQLVTARALPQLSVPVTWPHAAPSRAQKAAFDSGVHATHLLPMQKAPAEHWLEEVQLVPHAVPLQR
jgi:hypothetical protein